MSSIFDGLATTLTDILGETVRVYPGGGAGIDVTGLFREDPVEAADEFASTSQLVLETTLRVPGDMASGISVGDVVDPGNGHTYKVVNMTHSGSPAADGFIIFVLERL